MIGQACPVLYLEMIAETMSSKHSSNCHEILKDGNPFMDIEITNIRPVEKLDDSVFAKP